MNIYQFHVLPTSYATNAWCIYVLVALLIKNGTNILFQWVILYLNLSNINDTPL